MASAFPWFPEAHGFGEEDQLLLGRKGGGLCQLLQDGARKGTGWFRAYPLDVAKRWDSRDHPSGQQPSKGSASLVGGEMQTATIRYHHMPTRMVQSKRTARVKR